MEMALYAPGFVAFAGNGSGEVLAFDTLGAVYMLSVDRHGIGAGHQDSRLFPGVCRNVRVRRYMTAMGRFQPFMTVCDLSHLVTCYAAQRPASAKRCQKVGNTYVTHACELPYDS